MAQTTRKPPSEADMLALLKSGEISVPPLMLQWSAAESRGQGPDAKAEVSWKGQKFRFVAEIKGRSTPKVCAQAIAQAIAYADRTGDNPMVVLPYLAPERLNDIERSGASGIDLCGNALVQVPGTLFVLRSGAPNKFPESYPIRAVYRGATSLVARALLLRAESDSLSDLDQFIRSRGGSLTLTTISKALRRMEDDVLIERRGGRARLLQAESLLDKLAAAYQPPRLRRTFLGSTGIPREALGETLSAMKTRAAFTGQTSTDRYAIMGREDRVRIYCESITELLDSLGTKVKPGDRFANLELRETEDPTVYFDIRKLGSLPFASPIQTYLELATGDKREQDAAEQVCSLILKTLNQPTEPL